MSDMSLHYIIHYRVHDTVVGTNFHSTSACSADVDISLSKVWLMSADLKLSELAYLAADLYSS